jgi:membrane-bound lytic murein transglycosylase D
MVSDLRRSGRFMKLARKIFEEEGVPVDLAWLAQIKSGWNPVSLTARGDGLWQFPVDAAKDYGLRMTPTINELLSIEQATRAAARRLKDLANRYNGDWELGMAAYNTGTERVDRAIAATGMANFWTIYPQLSGETRSDVPNVLAVILIAKNPQKYGFTGIKPEAPLSYDVVQLPTPTSLELIAAATDSSVDYVRSLNPELRTNVTPDDGFYNVRVPSGRSKELVILLKRIPAEKRATACVVSIVPGEDLQSVANRTGASIKELQVFNSGVDFSSTTKLIVPTCDLKLINWHRTTPNSPPKRELP